MLRDDPVFPCEIAQAAQCAFGVRVVHDKMLQVYYLGVAALELHAQALKHNHSTPV